MSPEPTLEPDTLPAEPEFDDDTPYRYVEPPPELTDYE